ncbi:hypothetical protein PMAYCL1PPCAC_25939, partial [Pristionchus mayeri]
YITKQSYQQREYRTKNSSQVPQNATPGIDLRSRREVDVENQHDLLVGDGDLNVDSGLDGDGGDLVEHVRGGVHVDDTLVDAHLVTIPGLGSLSARSLAGGDAEHLGGHANGALNLELLLLSAVDEEGADCKEGSHVLGREGNADAVLSAVSNGLVTLDSGLFQIVVLSLGKL